MEGINVSVIPYKNSQQNLLKHHRLVDLFEAIKKVHYSLNLKAISIRAASVNGAIIHWIYFTAIFLMLYFHLAVHLDDFFAYDF